MKKHLGVIAFLSFLLFTYAHAAQNPFQRAELIRHPITGDTVRVFDILVRIDSADVDGLGSPGDIPEIARPVMSYTCNSQFQRGRELDVSWHPTGVCYQIYIEATFRKFADYLYEATNGKHLLGKVHFVKDFVDSSYVDVEWISNHGSGCFGNYFVPDEYGRRGSNACADRGAWGIEKGDAGIKQVHRDKYDGNRLMSPVALAATLTHEWGHYALGLPDEYTFDDGYTIVNPERFRNLLVNPDKPISTPVNGSEWKLWNVDDTTIITQAWRTFNNIISASEDLNRAMSEVPSLMYHQWVTYFGDAGAMRYANLSTDYMYCEEGANATANGKCTPKTFYATRGGVTLKRSYSSVGPAWPKLAASTYRWPELATVAPRYDDVDAKGNRFVKIDSTSEEIMRHYLHLDWSLWDTTMSYDRSVMFLVDLSGGARDSVSIGNLKRTIAAALLLAENQPNLNIGFQAAAYDNPSWQYVPIQPVKDAAPKILDALEQMRFGGLFIDYGLQYFGYEPLAERPETEKKHLVFFTRGLISGASSFPMNDFRERMDAEGVRFHVQYFLDSVKHLPSLYDFAGRTRSFSGTVAYDFSERDDAGLYDELRLLASTMGFDAVKLVPRAANHAYGETRSLKFHDGMAPLKSIGETCGFLHFKETPYGAKDSVCVETKSTSLQDLKPYQLCEVEPETWHEVAARDKSYRNATKMSPSGEQGTAFGTVEEQIVTKENPVVRFYSQSGAANLLPGEALLLHYEIGGAELLAGISPRAEICDISRPEAKCDTVFLRDDGANGDAYSGDGRYVLQWSGYKTSGPFRVEVVVDSLPSEAHWVGIEGGAIRKAEPDEFTGESSLFHFAVLGEVENTDTSAIEPVLPKLKVSARDHHFGHPQISVLSFKVENVGETMLEGATLHYFFTMPEATPYLLDYYTPDFDPQIVDHGEGRYELRMPLAANLAPGAIMPEETENQLHLRGTNYETLNVLDDWSNPKSVTFVETDSVVVTDKNGNLVHGVAPEWWTMGGVQ